MILKINKKEGYSLFMYLGLMIVIAVIFSSMVGRYFISPVEIFNTVIMKITGRDGYSSTVLFEIRLSRIWGALIIGASLSAAGTAYQGVFRNPMVSPDILGASAGAGFGASIGIILGLNSFFIQICAFIAGIIAVISTLFISNSISKIRVNNSSVTLLLTGMVISTLFSGFVSIVKYSADPYNTLPAITFWMMGGLNYITNSDVLMILLPFLTGTIILILLRWRLNVLSLGEEEAESLGVNSIRLTRVVVICATLITSASVAVGGMIAWVGLIVPHIARMFVGPDHKKLLPISILMGSLFLLLVDDAARCIFAQEIPIGIFTSIIGAPLFLYLFFKGRRG